MYETMIQKGLGRVGVGLLAFSILGSIACTEETAGESIEFETAAVGAHSMNGSLASFTNARGWRVELSEARVAVGPIYFYSALPQASWLQRALGIRVAHACPAHAQYDRGSVLGEVLQQYVIDLLSGQVQSTGRSTGEAGLCRMLELHLHPITTGIVPPGSPQEAFSPLQGHTAWISGTASKEDQNLSFQGGMTIPPDGTMRIVENIAASIDLADASKRPGRAVVEIFIDQWLINVDFSTLPEEPGGGVRTFNEDSQAYAAWMTGMRSRFAYGLSWRD